MNPMSNSRENSRKNPEEILAVFFEKVIKTSEKNSSYKFQGIFQRKFSEKNEIVGKIY